MTYCDLLGAISAEVSIANGSRNADRLASSGTVVAGKEAQALNLIGAQAKVVAEDGVL